MKQLHSHFDMHSRFRNGIFLLVAILFCSAVGCRWFQATADVPQSFVVNQEVQRQIDSLHCIAAEKQKARTQRSFNPNFISDYKGYLLGMSPKELDRLYAYRASGKWVNSVADFKTVTQVSDSVLKKIAPLFRFPEWTQHKRKHTTTKKYPVLSFKEKKDLNTVTAITLQQHIGIPEYIAKRIVKYRTRIGGFLDVIQLKDVYGLYDHKREKIEALYTVKSISGKHKININTATAKDLMEVPYFDFETALRIVELVQQNQGISDFKTLEIIDGFSLEKIDRIALYLTLE